MQRGFNSFRSHSFWLITLAMLCLSVQNGFAQFIVNPTVAKASAAPFEPTPTPSSVNRKLKQWDALLADQAWDEAIDLIEQLQTEQGDQWIETSPGANRFQTLSQACQQRLASLPAAGLIAYRQRVDSSAEQLLNQGIEQLDSRQLEQVAKEYFASSFGDDALLALGEIAFSKGDMVAARRAWLRIDNRLQGPFGEPIESALSDITPQADPALLARLWLEAPRPSDTISYPDTDIRLADLLARLIMTSIQDNQQVRARAELRLLKAIAPNAAGWLAGREQPLVSYLEKISNTTYEATELSKSSTTRINELHAWQWPQSLAYVTDETPQPNRQALRRVIRLNAQGQRFQFFEPIQQAAVAKKPTHHPVVSGNIITISTLLGLKGWNLADGKEVDTKQLAQEPLHQVVTNNPNTNQRQLIVNGRPVPNSARSVRFINRNRTNIPWPGTLTAFDDVIYFASQPKIVARNSAQRRLNNLPLRLIGIKPNQEGKTVLELTATEASDTIKYHFAGPPTVRSDQLYVVLSNVSARRELAVACYSISQNALNWITPIGSSEGGLAPQQYVSLQVMVRGDTAYLATNQGAVVALDAASGDVRWLTRYPRKSPTAIVSNQHPTASKPILSGDRLYVGPTDSAYALAFNTGNGQIVWSGEPIASDAKLVAVTANTVLFGGEQVEGLDPITGQRRFLYPESRHAGLRGKGLGLVIGDEYFWPTRNEIQVLELDTGRPTRTPIDLMSVGSEGAILCRAGNRLVVAGPTHMNVLGDRPPPRTEPIPQLSRLMEQRHPTVGLLLSKNMSKTVTP